MYALYNLIQSSFLNKYINMLQMCSAIITERVLIFVVGTPDLKISTHHVISVVEVIITINTILE